MHGVLFDKDGTLIDFDSTWVPVYREATLHLADGDAVLAEDMMLRSGYDPRTGRCRGGTVLSVGTTDQMVATWRPDLSGPAFERAVAEVDQIYIAGASKNVTPLADLRGLFATLRQSGYALGIATNDATRSAELCFEGLGLAAELDFITGYDGVANPKPAADMALAFCTVCGIEPGNIAVVGDNVHDLEMGVAAGAGFTIGVLSGTADPGDFGPEADTVLATVAEVPGAVLERFAARG